MHVINFLTHNDTYCAGITLGKLLKAGDCIFLSGELGAGKTTFAKGIAKGLNLCKEITSPTFTILNYYDDNIPVCHFDLYRLDTIEELECVGFFEYFYDNSVIKIIEWAEKFPEVIKGKGLLLRLEQKNGVCTMHMTTNDKNHSALMEEWIKNVAISD